MRKLFLTTLFIAGLFYALLFICLILKIVASFNGMPTGGGGSW